MAFAGFVYYPDAEADDKVPLPLALTPNAVELIPTLGALFPRGGPIQDPVLTHPRPGLHPPHRGQEFVF